MANTCTQILTELGPLITEVTRLEKLKQTPVIEGEIKTLEERIENILNAYSRCKSRPPVPLQP